MKIIAAILSLLAANLLLCSSQQFTVNIPVIKDAYVNASSPNTNYGNLDYMVLYYFSKQFSVIGFDISQYLQPVECRELVLAQLVLPPLLDHDITDEQGHLILALHDQCPIRVAHLGSTDWEEDTVTYANLDNHVLRSMRFDATTTHGVVWVVTDIVEKAIRKNNPKIDFRLAADPCALPTREAGEPSILRLTFDNDTCDRCVSQSQECDFYFQGTNYNSVPTFDLRPCPGTGVGDCPLTPPILHKNGTPIANGNSQDWEALVPGMAILGSEFSRAHQFYANGLAAGEVRIWTQEFNNPVLRKQHEGLCVRVPLQSYRIGPTNCNYPGAPGGCAPEERACVVFNTA